MTDPPREQTPEVATWPTADDEQSDESDDDELHDAEMMREILALCVRGNRLGCARYRPLHCRVEVFEVPVFLGVELTTSLKQGRTPATETGNKGGAPNRRRADATADTRLLHSDDIPPSLLWLYQYVQLHAPIALLADSGSDLLGDVLSMAGHCTVLHLSATTGFNAARALPQLCSMYPHVPEADLRSRFAMTHVAMLAAMAALLQYASTLRLNVADVVERGPVSVLLMNSETLRALQITRQDAHPCGPYGISQSKEGLSLFSVLDHTRSAMGRALLRQWLLLPSCDAEEIHGRQEAVAFFMAPQHHELLTSLRNTLRGFHSTNHLFTLIRRGRAHRRHYHTLHRTLRAILTALELVAPVAHECAILFDLVANRCQVDALQDMVELLQRTVHGVCGSDTLRASRQASLWPSQAHQPVLPEAVLVHTVARERTHLSINSEADNTGLLGELRLHLDSLSSALECRAWEAFDELEPVMREAVAVRCVYISPYGYLVCASRASLCDALHCVMTGLCAYPTAPGIVTAASGAPANTGPDQPTNNSNVNGGAEPDAVHGAWAQTVGYLQQRYGWTLHHEDDNTDMGYFKTAAMSDLDAKVGDLQRRIVEREAELRRDVDESLLFLSLHVLAPSRALAVLDCLAALAHVAQQYQWCRPHLVQDKAGVIDIDGGWHPVLCRAIGTSIVHPFSLRLGTDETERVCVLMGQNGSGKSVLLNTVALIALLTQIGSFVPAAAASMSIFSSIWTSTGCLDGYLGRSVRASSFASECLTVNRILRYCDGAQMAAPLAHARDLPAANDVPTVEPRNDTSSTNAYTPPAPLVLLDEFGKGTAPEDGRALLGAVLRHFCHSTCATVDKDGHDFSDSLVPPAQPTVLCTTHHLELLWCNAQRRESPDLAFPYERVTLVDMRGEPVYADDTRDGSAVTRSVVDFIPTFEPHVITSRPGHHEENFAAYRSSLLVDAAIGGRQIGLPEELLESWQNALRVVAAPD